MMSAALLRQRRPFSEAATAAADASSASTSTSEAFGPGTTRLSDAAEEALNDIGESVQKTRKKVQLTKADLRKLQGNPRKYRLIGDRPEFHNVERNKNGHICEPTDKFQVVITSSKNNCWINVLNKSRNYRIIFTSHAGNVGYRGAAHQSPACTERIAQNIARKCKRLGITHVDVKFRRVMKVDTCLQTFHAQGLTVTGLLHMPRLPKVRPPRARERRRV
ncbi:unnamed protein product [Vitrella brassicaformis CCMP3155]|uniref:Ribosomal protein S11 n=1 Tax=Vitrella brassicaformis (strain CCMP3155) TaxID=1169540 RepID=A0A0G4FFV9_VITBC|nr:unnamed protein product [Vitrella brassicaformis CCMP3155]|eukprot:CEM12107.1 unnamed protein product [Vitrella brassicaformis CCMP3155]